MCAGAPRDSHSPAEPAVEFFPYQPCAGRVWELRENVTCHDGWYVAVAELLDAPLATLDGRLANSPGPRCRFLLPPVAT